jgi:hypothetical protein
MSDLINERDTERSLDNVTMQFQLKWLKSVKWEWMKTNSEKVRNLAGSHFCLFEATLPEFVWRLKKSSARIADRLAEIRMPDC